MTKKTDACGVVCADLPFAGFDQDSLEQNGESWEKYSHEVLAALEHGNVGLLAETGAGKTIISLLAALKNDSRTLFLAPVRNLCHQHQKLLDCMTGHATPSTILTGETLPAKRQWNNAFDRVIFATPENARNDIQAGRLDLDDVDLIIMDEFHRAVGNYAYTSIAKWAENKGVKLLGLTATLPPRQMELIKDTCGINSIIEAKVKTPKKLKDLVLAEMTVELRRIEELLTAMLANICRHIGHLGIPTGQTAIISASDLKEIEDQIKRLDRPWFFQALSFLASYRKVRHAWSVVLTESYQTFIDYEGKLKKQKNKAARLILQAANFQEALQLATLNVDAHPKVLKLLEILQSWSQMRKNALVFVNNKDTLRYLQSTLDKSKLRSATIAGGQSKKNLELIGSNLKKLSAHELDCVLTTSVVEEGLNVPEIDAIMHFSMPQTGIAHIQRDGRTGRLRVGNVIAIALDHPLDKARYFSSLRKPEKKSNIKKTKTKERQLEFW